MKRLHVVVEGHGDVEAVPALAARVLHHLEREGWIVHRVASRIPRGRIVGAGPAAQGRPLAAGLELAVGFARAARADALLVVVDADDDCPASFGPEAAQLVTQGIPASVVMAVREFETWLAMAVDASIRDERRRRDGKGVLRKFMPGYKPTVHQAALAKKVDVAGLLKRQPRSFVKFVRDLDRLTGGDSTRS
ncbi:MAG: hypothetical protein JNK15_07480 [Planctomycetes bacterium]|nr:hypothetical protein [Planctomycetota bacterium]